MDVTTLRPAPGSAPYGYGYRPNPMESWNAGREHKQRDAARFRIALRFIRATELAAEGAAVGGVAWTWGFAK